MHINHSVAGACALALRTPHRHDLPHRRLQVRSDARSTARRPTSRRSRASAKRACSACFPTAPTPSAPATRRRSASSARRFANMFARAHGPDHRHVVRLERPAHPAGRRSGACASTGGSRSWAARCSTSSTSRPNSATCGSRRPTHIKLEQIDEYPPEEVVVMTTGSQGEPMSALSRLVGARPSADEDRPRRHGRDQRDADPGQRDAASRKTINNLYRLGATVIHGSAGQAHVSGHASQEELLLMLNLVRPRYFIPVHGEYRMLVTHGGARAADRRRTRELLHRRERRRRPVHRGRRARKSARPTAATSWSTAAASATSAKRCCATASTSPPTGS